MSTQIIVPGLVALLFGAISLQGATLSRQHAEAFEKKLERIAGNGTTGRSNPQRTAILESEVNSWFAYRADTMLPEGVSQPTLTLVGGGKVRGQVTVDLDAVGKHRSTGGVFDPWNLLGGRLPISVSGIVHANGGQGRFELEQADVAGIPVPKSLIQELLSYYSRSADNPQGVRLDDAFDLPANIRRIEVGPGEAVVFQ
jgi:hypothetical protein